MWVTERNYPSTRTSSINGSKQSFWRGFGRHGHGNKNSDESHHQPKPLSCAATLLLNLRFHHHTVTQCRCFRNKAPSFSQTQKKITEGTLRKTKNHQRKREKTRCLACVDGSNGRVLTLMTKEFDDMMFMF